jgi:hypothetical protein
MPRSLLAVLVSTDGERVTGVRSRTFAHAASTASRCVRIPDARPPAVAAWSPRCAPRRDRQADCVTCRQSRRDPGARVRPDAGPAHPGTAGRADPSPSSGALT